MKKSIRVIAVAMIAVILCMSFASCGLFAKKLNGEYVSDYGILGKTTFEFKGKDVEVSYTTALGKKISQEGTYKIEDDTITFTFFEEDGDEDDDAPYAGSFEFKEDKDAGTITIGKIEYKKVEK